jgi:hypothetical protein
MIEGLDRTRIDDQVVRETIVGGLRKQAVYKNEANGRSSDQDLQKGYAGRQW